MASRLYPGFGSGKGTYSGDFDVKSYSSLGKLDMEFGDKIILPPSALKEINKLKLPFPLIFKIGSDKGYVPTIFCRCPVFGIRCTRPFPPPFSPPLTLSTTHFRPPSLKPCPRYMNPAAVFPSQCPHRQ